MCNLIIKYTVNNIFLTVLVNNKKIYYKSSGQSIQYSKGKRKVSNLALLFLVNTFFNFFLLNFFKKKFSFIIVEFYGCTTRRFFFFKYNLKSFFKKFKFKYLFFLDKNFFAFNGCRLKKKKRKRKRRRRKKIRIN